MFSNEDELPLLADVDWSSYTAIENYADGFDPRNFDYGNKSSYIQKTSLNEIKEAAKDLSNAYFTDCIDAFKMLL